MNEPTSIQDQLQELRDLTQENNKLLKAMRRDALIGGILKTLIWVAVLGVSVYISMQYLDPLLRSFTGATEGMSQEDFQRIFDEYKAQFGQ